MTPRAPQGRAPRRGFTAAQGRALRPGAAPVRFSVAGMLVALWALGSAGCLLGDVTGVPCAKDGECPTTYFCDLPRAACRKQSDHDGPPALRVDKVRDSSGDLVLLPKVPDAATSPLGLHLVNDGDGPADLIGVSFTFLACVEFRVPPENVPDTIPGKGDAEVGIEVTTGGPDCGGVQIVDWFLTFSGREQRGAFDLDVLQNP